MSGLSNIDLQDKFKKIGNYDYEYGNDNEIFEYIVFLYIDFIEFEHRREIELLKLDIIFKPLVFDVFECCDKDCKPISDYLDAKKLTLAIYQFLHQANLDLLARKLITEYKIQTIDLLNKYETSEVDRTRIYFGCFIEIQKHQLNVDMLLHKNKMELYDINIMRLAEKYPGIEDFNVGINSTP